MNDHAGETMTRFPSFTRRAQIQIGEYYRMRSNRTAPTAPLPGFFYER